MPDTHRVMGLHDAGERERRFDQLYAETYVPIRAYARRRCRGDVAQDVVAETFLVAWRRLDEVPDDPLPWLYGVARRTIANTRRGLRRAEALADRAASTAPPGDGRDIAEQLGEVDVIRRAVASLPDGQREAVMLVAWEGLDGTEAARVAGCSRATFAVRLHRARKRLAAALATEASEREIRRTTVEVS